MQTRRRRGLHEGHTHTHNLSLPSCGIAYNVPYVHCSTDTNGGRPIAQ